MTACSKTTGSGGRLHQRTATGSGGRLHQKSATGSGRRLHQKSASGSGRNRCHSGGFLLRIMPPSWHPVPACARHDTPQAKPFFLAAMAAAGGAILYRHDDCAASIRKSGLEIKNRCTKEDLNGENLASIRKSGPEIKNRCTQQSVNQENPASIRKCTT